MCVTLAMVMKLGDSSPDSAKQMRRRVCTNHGTSCPEDEGEVWLRCDRVTEIHTLPRWNLTPCTKAKNKSKQGPSNSNSSNRRESDRRIGENNAENASRIFSTKMDTAAGQWAPSGGACRKQVFPSATGRRRKKTLTETQLYPHNGTSRKRVSEKPNAKTA